MRILRIRSASAVTLISIFYYTAVIDFMNVRRLNRFGVGETLLEFYKWDVALPILAQIGIWALTLALLFVLHTRILRHFPSLFYRVSFVYGLFYLGVLASTLLKTDGGYFFSISVYIVLVLALLVHHFAYLQATHHVKKIKAANFFSYLVVPFFERSTISRPFTQLSQPGVSQENFDKEALKIALSVLAMVLVGAAIRTFAYGLPIYGFNPSELYIPLPYFANIGLNLEIVQFIPGWKIVLSMIVSTALFSLNYLSLGLLSDCFYRILGYSSIRHFVLPYRVRSFAEYYSSIIPYYANFMNAMFNMPLYVWMRKKGLNKYWSSNISLFLGVFFFGVIFHSLMEVQFIYRYGLLQFLLRLCLNSLAYCTIIFVGIKYAVIDSESSTAKRILFSVGCLLIHAFALFFRTDYIVVGEVEKLRIIAQILGL